MKSQSCVKLSQDFLPHFLQNGPSMVNPKATVVKKRFLVFNDNGQSKYIAILRIWNPTANSDVFYKLNSDEYKQNFQVKSWKGRVRKNSHVDVTIAANVFKGASSSDKPSSEDQLPELSLSQLCQCKFSLEMTECVTKWRAGLSDGSSQRSEHNLVVKIELYCVTREILMQTQSETTLNLDNVSESCDDIEKRIAKYVLAFSSSDVTQANQSIAQVDSPGANCKETIEQLALTEDPPPEEKQSVVDDGDVSDSTESDSLKSDEVTDQSEEQLDEAEQGELKNRCSLNEPSGITPAFFALLMMFMDMALNVLSTSMLYSKQFACKIARRFVPKANLTESSEKRLARPSELD